MDNQNRIYADGSLAEHCIRQIEAGFTSDITAKLALYHAPFHYDQEQKEQFESRINQSLNHSDVVVVLCSELHDKIVDFMHRYSNTKIKFFICGAVDGVESFDWMDWFITSRKFYKTNTVKVLDRLTPYSVKPKVFDILLGQPRDHRDIIYNFINTNHLNNQVLMTYISYHNRITANENNSGWIWEDEGIEIIDRDPQRSSDYVSYYGDQMLLSQIVPIQVYNQTAYSVVCETNYSDNFVFNTEKIVKPILARRLFIAFAGKHYLRNLQRLGFRTFNNIIDESYDDEPDYKLRGKMICHQISYLLQQDQQKILNAIRPIVDHNYDIMMNTDWSGNFLKELQAVLLGHVEKNLLNSWPCSRT